ncbi:MAG: mannose-1-phosphate guanylyltransferase [bacterium P3]|nr:MAG: mannose-1-phosphate guanylyltransferase [bacterium P3]KWW40073.1 MAG: mannose-1-phosphate guanylyltransferase [bacterium F083]
MNERYCIIMAGGVGSRFWPLSKDNCPKQFLDILGTGKSFIRSTFERFRPLVPDRNFVVVTNAAYRELVRQHLPELDDSQVLCEPMRRNTAPCIAYATYHIQARCSQASIAVTPADHLVTNEQEFQRVIATGLDFVEQRSHEEALLTIGIRPSRPETGYGYIQVDPDKLGPSADGVVETAGFKEKPDLPTAQRFLEAGNYFWNSGIFIWSLKGIRQAFHRHLPEMERLFDQGTAHFGTPSEQSFVDSMFARCENISVDYGIMERSDRCYTIPAEFGWSDIGTWGSLFAHARHDDDGNAKTGNALLVDTRNSIVNIETGTTAIVQGLDHCLVAYRDHSLLVCRIDDEQEIKHWVERLGQ